MPLTKRRVSLLVAAAGLGLVAVLAQPSAAFEGTQGIAVAPTPLPALSLQLGFGFTEAAGVPLVLQPAERLPLAFSARTQRERDKWMAVGLAAIGLALIVPDNDDSLETLFFAAAAVGVVMYMDEPRPEAPGGLPPDGMMISIRNKAPNLGYQLRW